MSSSVRTAPARSTRPTRGVRRRRRFPLRAGQVVVWELAAAGSVLAAGFGTVPGVVVGGIGLLAVLTTVLPRRGRWFYQWLVLVARYRSRRRAGRPGPAGDPLDLMLPGLAYHTYADRAGNRIGVAGDGRSWTAVLRIGPTGIADPAELIGPMRAAYHRSDLPAAAVQLVRWTVPVAGADPVRMCWLALRLAPADCRAAVEARGGGPAGALRATANAALSLARDLYEAGVPAAPLDGTELRAQLAVALGADPDIPATVTEDWRTLTVGTLRQSCYRPRSNVDPAAVLAAGAPSPAAFTAASLTLSRPGTGTTRGEPEAHLVLRVGAPAAQTRYSPDDAAAALGIPVYRLDGEHICQTRATLPLALPPS